jgi:hypothetical protein
MYQHEINKIVSLTKLQWEFYFYNVIFGLFQAPYYAVSLFLYATHIQCLFLTVQ